QRVKAVSAQGADPLAAPFRPVATADADSHLHGRDNRAPSASIPCCVCHTASMSDAQGEQQEAEDATLETEEVVTVDVEEDGTVVVDDVVAEVDAEGNVVATDELVEIDMPDGTVIMDETFSVADDQGELTA